MNCALIIVSLLFSLSAIAIDKKDSQQQKLKDFLQRYKPFYRGHHSPESVIDVIPLNSPVKESTAKFLLKVPQGFDIAEVKYKVKNASRLFEKDQLQQKTNLVDGPEGKELRISVSKLPPGFYQLFVKIRDRKNKEHEYKSKYKDHAMFIVDKPLEVPMPDPKKNDATIVGVDSDHDGIRDDIQRWINESFSSRPKTKMALRELAMGMQLELVSSNDKVKSIIASRKMLSDLHCLRYIAGQEARDIKDELKSKMLNTKDRHYSEIKTNENLSGQSWSIPVAEEDQKAACAFNPDSLKEL